MSLTHADIEKIMLFEILGAGLERGTVELPQEVRLHLAECPDCRIHCEDYMRQAFGARVSIRYELLRKMLRSGTNPHPIANVDDREFYFLPSDSRFGSGMTLVVNGKGEILAAAEGPEPIVSPDLKRFPYYVVT